jgi:hypothetical protein
VSGRKPVETVFAASKDHAPYKELRCGVAAEYDDSGSDPPAIAPGVIGRHHAPDDRQAVQVLQ